MDMSKEIIEAMNNLSKAINNYTEEIRKQNPNRLLTIEEIAEEYNVNEQTVSRKIFSNPDVVVNRLNMNKVIQNKELWKYFETRH